MSIYVHLKDLFFLTVVPPLKVHPPIHSLGNGTVRLQNVHIPQGHNKVTSDVDFQVQHSFIAALAQKDIKGETTVN